MIPKVPMLTLHRYVLLSVLVFLTVELLIFSGINVAPFLTNYLNDFLVIPLVAFICLHTIWFIKKNYRLQLNAFNITSLVVMYAIYFEYYLPEHHSRYTSDVCDVVCYAAGGVVFYFLQKAP